MASQTDRIEIELPRSSPERDERVEHVIDMEGRSHEQDIFEACIFKVNEGLVRTNYNAYAPSFISIGPYHYQRTVLRKEQFKSEYFRSLLRRTNGELTRGKLLEILMNLESKARSCYGDPIGMSSNNEFVEMLLLDGCFVVEFVIRSKSKLKEEDEYDLTPMVDDWTETQVVRDMLLMENQLPFFVLNEIYRMITPYKRFDRPKASFLDLVKVSFLNMLPKLRYFSLYDTEVNEHEIKHLLQVMHILCCPGVNKGQQKKLQSSASDFAAVFPIESCHIRSASELLEAGICFNKVGDIGDKSFNNTYLFDIKFNHGVLEIPSFKVVASTETIFRNLIFYEQRSIYVHPKYFSEYAVFMDNLINTDKDVSLLRLNGIIINGLGDDKKVADLFNNLSQEVVYSYRDFYYADECYGLIQHCNKPWNVMMAKLRHDYFNTPWAGISTVAAILLLLLTAAQTVAAYLGL